MNIYILARRDVLSRDHEPYKVFEMSKKKVTIKCIRNIVSFYKV